MWINCVSLLKSLTVFNRAYSSGKHDHNSVLYMIPWWFPNQTVNRSSSYDGILGIICGPLSIVRHVLQEIGYLASGSSYRMNLQECHKMRYIASNVILDFLSSEDNCLLYHSNVINSIDRGTVCIFKMFENATQSHQLLFFSEPYFRINQNPAWGYTAKNVLYSKLETKPSCPLFQGRK